jgi:hypothetical protein
LHIINIKATAAALIRPMLAHYCDTRALREKLPLEV